MASGRKQLDKKEVVRTVASERITALFALAEQAMKENEPALAKRYVSTLRRISSHYKVPIPKRISDSICTGCGTVLIPGMTCSVRLVSSRGYVACVCSNCKSETHVFYKKSGARP